jgi:hypothetical protein
VIVLGSGRVAAGKVSGPGGPAPNDAPGAPEGPKKDERPAAEGSRFADKLGSAGARSPATAAEASRGITADLAADLGAGKITAKAAIDRVIERVVDKQVGVDAPAAVREKVRAALETAVADDPLLSEKIKALGS